MHSLPPLTSPNTTPASPIPQHPNNNNDDSATADPGPLNRAEWAKYLAAFFNREAAANRLYGGVKSSYDAIESAVAAARRGAGAERAPLVAWVSSNETGVTFRFEPYKTQLIQVGVLCAVNVQ